MNHSITELFLNAGPVVKGVLLGLVLFSVASWGIILTKFLQFSLAGRQNAGFLAAFERTQDMQELRNAAERRRASPLANLFRDSASAARAGPYTLRRTLNRSVRRETDKLFSQLAFLATTGSTAPFIGLLGTVWGIMEAFSGIGASGSASLDVVAPSIAEALVATAAGLAAAIPAVMSYNYGLSKATAIAEQVDEFADTLRDTWLGTKA